MNLNPGTSHVYYRGASDTWSSSDTHYVQSPWTSLQVTSQTGWGALPGAIGHFTGCKGRKSWDCRNLLWDVKWRIWKPGKGEIKVVWEGGSVENREKRGQKGLVMCKQLLVSTLVWSCPLPDMYNLSCSLSKLHFWVTGYSVWMCTYGGPSARYWREDHGSEDLCIHGAGRCSIWGCARQCVITREYHKLD